MKILIPTCKTVGGYDPQFASILQTATESVVIKSGLNASASVNRNWCIDHVEIGEVAIMLDDDIEGFYPGWVDDLTKPLADPTVVMVSARLLNPDGTFGPTCSRCYDDSPEEIEIFSNGECILPTAAIAFRFRGICFDEHFIGSGYEDSDWCHSILAADPTCRFIQSNLCRLIHRNEMKNQKGPYWKHNMAYFWNKWRPSRVTA